MTNVCPYWEIAQCHCVCDRCHWGVVIREVACCFIAVHGNVHKVPAGSCRIRFNITPWYTGPWCPFVSLDMALLSAGMWLPPFLLPDAPLKTAATGSGVEGLRLRSAAN